MNWVCLKIHLSFNILRKQLLRFLCTTFQLFLSSIISINSRLFLLSRPLSLSKGYTFVRVDMALEYIRNRNVSDCMIMGLNKYSRFVIRPILSGKRAHLYLRGVGVYLKLKIISFYFVTLRDNKVFQRVIPSLRSRTVWGRIFPKNLNCSYGLVIPVERYQDR